MSDIRKRSGSKGVTYQVRYPSAASKTGYAYKTFATMKEARAFREDAGARSVSTPQRSDIRTVGQGVQKWLDICEKEGRNGREPVTRYTLDNYEYRAEMMKKYSWGKDLQELTKPDIINFRSWLLENYSRDVAHKVLTWTPPSTHWLWAMAGESALVSARSLPQLGFGDSDGPW